MRQATPAAQQALKDHALLLKSSDPRAIRWFAKHEAETPTLIGDANLWWLAFNELQGDRQIGFGGRGPIPFSAIDAWAKRQGIEGDDFQWLTAAVVALSEVQLRHEADERKKHESTKGKG